MLVRASEKVNFLYLVKKGEVRQWTNQYQYISQLSPGSFFGDYNILFDLYSNVSYQVLASS